MLIKSWVSNPKFCHQEFIASQNRPKSTRITRLIQGYETHAFKANFDSWPSGSAAPGAEEGRGKVAGNTHVNSWSQISIFFDQLY